MRQVEASLILLTGILSPWEVVNSVIAFQIKHPLSLQHYNHPASCKLRRHRSPQASCMIQNQRIAKTALNDLSEWRDLFFDESEKPTTVNQAMQEEHNLEGPSREVCIFPFPLDDILLQGETKELCLYEDRFHQLFQKSLDSHAGVVAMGLIAPPAGILQVMPLCEIEAFRRMPGQTEFDTSFSIYVTIRVVGRASLVHVVEEDVLEGIEYLKGWCVEVNDEVKGDTAKNRDARNIKLGNDFANRLEEMMDSIIKLEDQLVLLGGSTDELESNAAVTERRILEAEMEMIDDDDDDDDDDDEVDNRRSRFERAYQVAKSTDMQGYKSTLSSTEPDEKNSRSLQDLTALSWAYFCTEEDPTESLVYRLRAVECDDLCLRLKLALMMMTECRTRLKSAMNGIVSEEYGEEEDE